MAKKVILSVLTLVLGIILGFLVIYNYFIPRNLKKNIPIINAIIPPHEVIGFLPYWLIPKASQDYSKYITTLNYFSLSVDKNGSIEKFTNPQESEPGYLALTLGKFDPFLNQAKKKDLDLAVTIFSADNDNINELLKDPKVSADNLTKDVIPIMNTYGFSDLNLDIEQVKDASPEARMKFTEFVKNVKENLKTDNQKTLSIDISAIAFVWDRNLIDPASIVAYVDKVILMAYDYHNTGSFVTGAVAPASGAGITSEFDTESAVIAALKIMPSNKLILGIPLYGYEWETINNTPHSATIPGTSLIISNQRAEDLLASCATCSAEFNKVDQESHIIYQTDSKTYQQIFVPTKDSSQYKVNFSETNSLGGIALWALGYEGKTILEPLSAFRR